MDIQGILKTLSLSEEAQMFFTLLSIRLGIFLAFSILSLLLGRYSSGIISFVIRRIFVKQGTKISQQFIEPFKQGFQVTGTLILLSLCLYFLREYQAIYQILGFVLSISLVISAALLASRLSRQFILSYGISLIQKLGWNADEFVLILETAVNILIGLSAVLIFANIHNINLFALVAGIGIGGIAIAFAAQRVLEQLIGTIVIYLDRPYLPGEYVRVNFNVQQPDVYGRIESIGLRSTKIRIAARNTLLIVPNSIMATKDIENISRGKKVMVLLYLDFKKVLEEQEKALVEKIVLETTNTLFGIDPGSTKIALLIPKDKPGSRARVSFFILGSNEDSTQLRKRLLELANKKITKQFGEHGIQFEVTEPTIYVDSPIPI
ncbi:MAG: mechanosensitive ion channel [Oscillatoriales cyanobacterium RM2_1_1]|nr:mechanosensitive ion channel [Oscillatoriales cyanobacterium SM2_3_0]NJO46050.1 mechanosensitive ion channel [Oscillatoriales cyanobacterium RM2_1_1]